MEVLLRGNHRNCRDLTIVNFYKLTIVNFQMTNDN